ncbi:MAG TPA: helix-turn-helix transcriptional regulator [Bacteroidales bacterium]|nr:helix-turn-helix transcriptional regulator [Bacteroidales bacterium]HPT11140.1 helix-turn-helix transcriptional regulator [Bacteroidales bacterium]
MNNRIKELRAGLNMSQMELAQKVGVRRETIVFLEKGKYNPSLKLAHDISRVFGLTIEEIFFFESN